MEHSDEKASPFGENLFVLPDKTVTLLRSTELVVYPFCVPLLNVSMSYRLWLIESEHMLDEVLSMPRGNMEREEREKTMREN